MSCDPELRTNILKVRYFQGTKSLSIEQQRNLYSVF